MIYHSSQQELSFMDAREKVIALNNKLKLRFIIDRNSIEIYANKGEVTFTRLFYPDANNMNVKLSDREVLAKLLISKFTNWSQYG